VFAAERILIAECTTVDTSVVESWHSSDNYLIKSTKKVFKQSDLNNWCWCTVLWDSIYNLYRKQWEASLCYKWRQTRKHLQHGI